MAVANYRNSKPSGQPAMNALLRFFAVLSVIASASAAAAVADSAKKVSFEIYYETLCPYCSNLIVNYLPELFESDLISITDLKLLPYGNAKISPNGTIVCQHGPYECLLNTVEACAIHTWPKLEDHFPFVYCVENLVYNNNYTYWETCFKKLGLDASPVINCLNSDLGKKLELRYAAATNALEPPHTYVPWAVVDGKPIYDDYRNFASYICKAYKGTNKPSACTKSSVGSVRKLKMYMLRYFGGEEPMKSKVFGSRQSILSWLQGIAMEIA
ncbi:gamma-interferon-responsive lysosomal thiol protein-like [Andrographis paniculata]|uniref:gamma-interferon-responsive lysosomal thiol protein-like n=1 Tax=Andrographis paniculata TaxID=175694 RepID=UPI0021E7FCB7|nr:gamma-interferon-responsive lysosomal thiol protein-like [Andrographis paniculata]